MGEETSSWGKAAPRPRPPALHLPHVSAPGRRSSVLPETSSAPSGPAGPHLSPAALSVLPAQLCDTGHLPTEHRRRVQALGVPSNGHLPRCRERARVGLLKEPDGYVIPAPWEQESAAQGRLVASPTASDVAGPPGGRWPAPPPAARTVPSPSHNASLVPTTHEVTDVTACDCCLLRLRWQALEDSRDAQAAERPRGGLAFGGRRGTPWDVEPSRPDGQAHKRCGLSPSS